jgi:hypothetical protein
MKKSVLLLTALLLASIAGTYAVYEFYVKARMKELGDHIEQEKRLRSKLSILDETFFGTEPDVVLKEWRESTQPWSDAIDGRTKFFTLGELATSVEIPEEKIPRFYYREELPKRIKALEDYALSKNVEISDLGCGVPGAESYGAGTNPAAAEIARHLKNYDYCAGLTKMFINAGPQSIENLSIWPTRDVKIKSRGTIQERTTGVTMLIRMEPLVRFLDTLAQSPRYIHVDALRISSANLNETDALLNVDLLITQSNFEPTVGKTNQASDAADPAAAQDRLNALFGGDGGAARRPVEDERKTTFWQWFRKAFIPF